MNKQDKHRKKNKKRQPGLPRITPVVSDGYLKIMNEENHTTELRGTCGENMEWRLVYGEGKVTMYLTGSGPMYAYTGEMENYAPWERDKDFIQEIFMDDEITDLGGFIFNECWDLTTVHFPARLRRIGPGAFAGCRSLEITELPDTVTRIEDGAFDSCPKLALEHLPPRLEYLGNDAFLNCSGLKLDRLPKSLVHIGRDAFDGCPKVSFS